MKLSYLLFSFAPSIRNPFNSPALTSYISKTTLNFVKLLKVSGNGDTNLLNKIKCKKVLYPP